MSRKYITVITPPAITAPRGAQWAASAALWIARMVSARPSGTRQPTLKTAP
jgi:hypothetical protein